MSKVFREGKKIVVKKDENQLEKEVREKRIKERQSSEKSSSTNRELMEYLNDTNHRLSEIYDMLKKLAK